jgi:heterodisulfide reductase subunit A
MYSLKFAHLIREHTGAQVYQFYIDMRCVGKNYEAFYDRLLGEGVRMVRGKVAEITDVAEHPSEKGKLVAQVEDTLAGAVRRIPLDMVVLANGLEAKSDSKDVARLFGVSADKDGFFMEQHPKLNPVGTPNQCIFVAGACSGPKDIPGTVAQAQAAAAGAIALLAGGTIALESITAQVNVDLCTGCRICSNVCPYGALKYDEELRHAAVDDGMCRGCGTCVAACPSGSIKQNLFEDDQIFAEIKGVLAHA